MCDLFNIVHTLTSLFAARFLVSGTAAARPQFLPKNSSSSDYRQSTRSLPLSLPRGHDHLPTGAPPPTPIRRHRQYHPPSPGSSPNICSLPCSSRPPPYRRSGGFLGRWIDWCRRRAVMNTRPVVLVLLLIVLIITSQFEWKQQIEDAAEADPATARRRQQVLAKVDAVKEKILLSQEKNIQQLNELIESLQRQLLHCRGSNNTVHTTTMAATEVSEVEGQEIIDD